MSVIRAIVFLAGAAGLAAVVGCNGDGRSGVEGAVTYAGEPITFGNVVFVPTEGKGVSANGTIANGRYAVEPRFGPMPGKHRVEITWMKPTGQKYKNEFGEEIDKRAEGLPDKYHAKSTLTADIVAGKNVIDFNLAK